MKKKLLFVGFLGLMLAFGLVVVGCNTHWFTCTNYGNCKAPGTTCGASKCEVKQVNYGNVECDC
ncbi:hypothetical protein AGMMS49579_04370 [Spirochaetia bacterium]|nr:hypothetical protein AGMMS49579_04370 [Spirochaetia bacterium]